MPIYEYECRKCHHRFEKIQKFSDPPIRKCPSCRGGRVEKLLSPSAVHFKGSGWYVTDYARKGVDEKGKEKDAKATKESKDTGGGEESGAKAAAGESSGRSTPRRKDRKKH